MIKSFSNKETEKIFNREISQKLSGDIQRTALRKLLLIDAAVNLNDLQVPPGNRLEKLTGNLKENIASELTTSIESSLNLKRGMHTKLK